MNNNVYAIDFVERHGNRKRKDSLSIINELQDMTVASGQGIGYLLGFSHQHGRIYRKISSRSIYRKDSLTEKESGGKSIPFEPKHLMLCIKSHCLFIE
jgi:hypothetical protein